MPRGAAEDVAPKADDLLSGSELATMNALKAGIPKDVSWRRTSPIVASYHEVAIR